MDNQRILECLDDIWTFGHEPTDEEREAVRAAMDAVQKQIPKKPNILTGKTEEDKLACCPTCNSNVDWTYDGFWRKGKRKYCHECGQAIDWSE